MYTALIRKALFAGAAVIMLIALMKIYFRSKNVTRSDFVKIFKTAGYFQAWILIFTILMTCTFGIFNHLHSKHCVQAVLSLNYSEASQAQNANGTRYNMADIICDEVVNRAIEMGAFENVTTKQLKQCLSVYPHVQGDVGDKSQYHISTEFVVEYNASKHTDHLDAENVICLITAAYKEYYIENYTDNYSLDTEQQHPDFSKMEYMDVVSYFNKETSAILNYLYGMAGKSPSFVTKNNTTFNSIAAKVSQFRETQIEQNLKSLILQHGVVRDQVGYIDRLSYQNKNTDFERQKNAVSFDLCNQAIAMYSEEMTRVVLVPTWDEVGKYYMGRTKVGIDELSVMASKFSDDVASNEKEIMNNNLIIGKMEGVSGNSVTHDPTDTLIASIDNSIKAFGKEAILAGREYSASKMNQCIAVGIYGVSLFSELKTIFVFAAFAYLALVLLAISKKFPARQQ